MTKKNQIQNREDSKSEHGTPLTQSQPQTIAQAQRLGPIDPGEEMTVTVLVHRKSVKSIIDAPQQKYLSREEFAKKYGAATEDLEKVKAFAAKHQLLVKEIHAEAGTVILSGSAAQFNQAFQIELGKYKHHNRTFRSHQEPVSIPDELAGSVEHIFGLDNRSQARAHFQIFKETAEQINARSASVNYTPNQVARFYQFPENVAASDQCIGLIELGGGYHSEEIKSYFGSLGIMGPVLTDVAVNGGKNQPTGDANGPDGEVVLDIEVAGAVAPGVKIAVYFAENTDAGFLNAINAAVHDQKNKPSVISISWGNAESGWTTQAMQAMDRAFQDARVLGVTTCSAAGDRGSADGVDDGLVHVDFPAASPNNLACGGTRLLGSGSLISNESVWNDGPDSSTGGGVSEFFPLPDWQQAAQVPPSANPGGKVGRGVPDIAGNADPETGYQILVDGQRTVIGGTSAVAPLWAGLTALLNQQLGHPIGFLNPYLYDASARAALRDIIQGNNDSSREAEAYDAHAGWDACTGMGSPIGTDLAALFLK
ncbi:MAG: S53 family peptidase [Sporolactobacillus sp.]